MKLTDKRFWNKKNKKNKKKQKNKKSENPIWKTDYSFY